MMAVLCSVLVIAARGWTSPLHFPIIHLEDSNWTRVVKQRDNFSVFVVMFHGEHCPACRQVYSVFQTAAERADGAVSFAEVDVDDSRTGRVAREYGVRTIPTFYVIYPGGQEKLNPTTSARTYLNAGMDRVPDRAWKANETWDSQASVILFTALKKSPIWNAVSCKFGKRADFLVGVSRDEALREVFNVTKVPTIVMTKEDNGGFVHEIYDGPTKFSAIVEAVGRFFPLDDATATPSPRPRSPTPRPTGVVAALDDFGQCRGARQICVVNRDLDPQAFERVARRFSTAPLRFWKCSVCPFPFAGSAPAWVIHNRRDQVIPVNSIEMLGTSLERVLDGTGPWVDAAAVGLEI